MNFLDAFKAHHEKMDSRGFRRASWPEGTRLYLSHSGVLWQDWTEFNPERAILQESDILATDWLLLEKPEMSQISPTE